MFVKTYNINPSVYNKRRPLQLQFPMEKNEKKNGTIMCVMKHVFINSDCFPPQLKLTN